MGLLLGAARVALVGFFLFGLLGTLGTASSNGYFELLDRIVDSERPNLPDSNIPMKATWTGIAPVDRLARVLLAVFCPMFDGNSPQLSIMSLYFFAQLYAAWTLMLVEANRVGNAWRFISFVTIAGVIAENVAAAVTLPAWFILHLLTSPTVSQSSSAAVRQTSLLVHPTELKVLPWSVFGGAIVPALLASVLPMDADRPFYATAQFWVILRQFHPILTAALQIGLSMFANVNAPQYSSSIERNRAVSKALTRTYTLIKYGCIAVHCSTGILMLGSAVFPELFSQEAVQYLEPVQIWTPPRFWSDKIVLVETAAQGLATFLKWDSPVTFFSTLLWAFAINRDALWTRSEASGIVSTIFQMFLMTAVGGPIAAAVTLLQERDEVLLEAHEHHEKKA